MSKIKKTVTELIANPSESPLPLEVIPNNMGVNLCAVESLEWERTPSGQLISLGINFIPAPEEDMEVITPVPTLGKPLSPVILSKNGHSLEVERDDEEPTFSIGSAEGCGAFIADFYDLSLDDLREMHKKLGNIIEQEDTK